MLSVHNVCSIIFLGTHAIRHSSLAKKQICEERLSHAVFKNLSIALAVVTRPCDICCSVTKVVDCEHKRTRIPKCTVVQQKRNYAGIAAICSIMKRVPAEFVVFGEPRISRAIPVTSTLWL